MNISVSQPVSRRKSTRGSIEKPIDNQVIRDILIKASLAPSGGNLQPLRIFILNKKSMKSFLSFQKSWSNQSFNFSKSLEQISLCV